MDPLEDRSVEDLYRDFAQRQSTDSPCYTRWAFGVAGDPEVRALVERLPLRKRQPNLVFAAARWHGAEPGPYDALRQVLLGRWDEVRATVEQRATQTNEVGRCATLLPLLATLPGPLALLEVGCSAGLCLYPDRYSYAWTREGGRADQRHRLDPPDGPSPVLLECTVSGDVPLPRSMPEVVWRGGVDLNPLDVRDTDAMAWLQTLVWPEHDDRRDRLATAVDVVREEPAASVVRGDLLSDVVALADDVPADATLVVFHSAVLAYLEEGDRVRFAEQVATVPGHWVSNEGTRVVPGVAATAGDPPAEGSAVGPAPFLLALDGRAVAWTQGHGRALRWI